MEQFKTNGAAGLTRFSGEVKYYTPALDHDNSSNLSGPNLPRSSTISSPNRRSSELSYNPLIAEMFSADNHLNTARNIDNARRYSYDERVSRMGASMPGYVGPHQGTSAVRQKSSSQEYVSGQADALRRMGSDVNGNIFNDKGRQLLASTYDNIRQASSFARSPWQSEQEGANRYSPSSQPIQQQWSPNSPHRSFFPESSPVHPLQSRLLSSLQQMPGQFLAEQGHYPPLPALGTLRHVQCQHCALLLAIPEKLPPSQKNTQKLRCGSCRKISIFSIPQAEGCNATVVVSGPSRSSSMNSPSMIPSSPENQAEFASAYKAVSDSLNAGERQRSGRRYSVSDLAQKQVQARLVRKHSLGNEYLATVDEEMVERALFEALSEALSEKVETMTLNSNSTTATPYSTSTTPEMINNPIYSDVWSPNVLLPEPLPTFSNNLVPYKKIASLQSRFSNIAQNSTSGGNIPARGNPSSEINLSDSDSDSMVRPQLAANSPQSSLGNSGCLTPLPNSSPLHDPRSTGRTPDDASNEPRNEQGHEDWGLNKTLNRIFMFRKSKHVGANQYRRKVVVNGVPIPDHLVKKAEEQAGRIRPGTYWYDIQAGFWGVAGGQCLGIIPPFIEEFNHPMTRDCAGGRTNIFVNGRELHYMDRDKLCRRGLPDTPGMSYRIEIDGRVIEEATGSELRGLRRLAPSMEKSGRGTGMHVPSPNISVGRG